VSQDAAPPPDGCDHLLAEHYLPVMRLCLSRLGDPADAEDATQEVFRRAVQHSGSLRDDPLPWLIAVARNVCNDELRRRRRRADVDPADIPSPSAHTTPEGEVVGRMAVVELLGRLTPGERRALAARLGVAGHGTASSTTRVLIARARQKLRHYLEESQSAIGTATVSTSEALHQLRTRFFGRALLGPGRAAVVIPAVLIITAVGGPGRAGGSFDIGPPQLRFPLPGAGVADAVEAQRLRGGEGGVDRALANVVQRSLGGVLQGAPVAPIVLPPPAGPTWYSSLPTNDYRELYTTDIEPSPTYATDHTVLMVGTSHTCVVTVCSQIYRSHDGGSTWSVVNTDEGQDTQLVLPDEAFPAHRFYLVGVQGLEVTWNDGGNFVSSVPNLNGHALMPPASSGYDVLYSNNTTLWGIGHDGTPAVLSSFGTGEEATGSPLVLQTAGGYVVLQPVGSAVPSTTSMLERCTPRCGAPQPLPMNVDSPTMLASPNVATDHTVYAVALTHYLLISHDDGQTFELVGPSAAYDMAVTTGPHGRRLVASMGTAGTLEYSDDDGSTWHTADVPSTQLFEAHSITQLRPGRLIASMQRSDDFGWYYFVCSSDGAVWALCGPDAGT